MEIKKGDWVEVLDESIIGKVLKFNAKEITFLTKDGFEMTFPKSDVIPLNDSFSVANFEVATAISEKELPKKKKNTVVPKKMRNDPRMEVDLHIDKLVKTTRGMTNHDMLTLQLDTAERQLNFAIRKKIQKIVFIHGVGEGVLKTELDYLLSRYTNIKFYDADYTRYGVGATEVYILQNAAN